MLESGYVRIFRSFLSWEWYDDANTMRVFLHLILTANWEPKKWRGITIERGQRVYSRSKLSSELRISEREVRTALNHLISTGEVTSQTTPQYSIVTIKNYELYQQATNETTSDRPATDQPSTSDRPQLKKDKESNKDKKDKKNIYSDAFFDYAFDNPELLKALNDFAEMRKAIKKPLSTEQAAKMLLTSLDKLSSDSKTKVEILNQSIFKNWQGVFELKEGGPNARPATNNEGNNGTRSSGTTAEVPKYGHVV